MVLQRNCWNTPSGIVRNLSVIFELFLPAWSGWRARAEIPAISKFTEIDATKRGGK
jgi:hypothetical protein